jgi:hypothetical protein
MNWLLIIYIGGDRPSQPSRAQRSALAAAEISSLSPGGIDARSLAATPPPSFTIRRVDQSKSTAMRPPGASRGAFQGQGSGMRGNSGVFRGRGGIRGRGRGHSSRGGRGKAGRPARKRAGGPPKTQDLEGAPLTPEEQAYVESVEMGVPTPARVGTTDLETLKREAPGVATLKAPIGLVNTIREHYRTLAGEFGNERLSTEQHAKHYLKRGATLFVDEEDKASAVGPNRWAKSPKTYDTLDEAERESILQTLAAGQYQPIKPMVKGDTLTAVDTYTRKNETYLPKDSAALKARVQRMLPSQTASKPARQAARQ